jgi:hypothetical protein
VRSRLLEGVVEAEQAVAIFALDFEQVFARLTERLLQLYD